MKVFYRFISFPLVNSNLCCFPSSFSSYGKIINLNTIIQFVQITGFHSFTNFLHKIVFLQ